MRVISALFSSLGAAGLGEALAGELLVVAADWPTAETGLVGRLLGRGGVSDVGGDDASGYYDHGKAGGGESPVSFVSRIEKDAYQSDGAEAEPDPLPR
jgi:hypothetical protein